MNILAELRSRFAGALRELVGDEAAARELAGMVQPSQDAKFGDYQANCAMPLGKRLSRPPREVAAELVARLEVSDLCESPEIAGPGFINLRLHDAWLAGELKLASPDIERIGVQVVAAPRRYVLDYSAPNVAKPMHVGHIRSTVIGDALYRVLKFLGHDVTSDNHIGDWGTQFGMIIYGWKHLRQDPKLDAVSVSELTQLYKAVNTLMGYHTFKEELPAVLEEIEVLERALPDLGRKQKEVKDAKEKKQLDSRIKQAESRLADRLAARDGAEQVISGIESDPEWHRAATTFPRIREDVLAETAKLHEGDAENRTLWERFLPPCLAEINDIYRRLGVTFDHALGESFYEEALAGVVKDLKAKGLARESDGAMCVFLEGHAAPFIVQKQDGAFLYATTDLATIQYRMRHWRLDAILYVVDHRQSLHFVQLFETARLWGYQDVELQHIAFGTVLGDDGRPFKTRTGSSVGLSGLLDEAVERAHRIVSENDDARPEPLLSDTDRQTVAERIGIGAIKYADLAHNRTSDYKFSYDKMLAMTGNTAAYMQYSYARVRSIFDKGGVDPAGLRLGGGAIELAEPAERTLGLAILQFSEALDHVVADYRPNHLTDYLFELASKYASFFENCPVLRAPSDAVRTSRLLLCDLTARTLACGLKLLGIEVVERM